jgi:hypothetical protein
MDRISELDLNNIEYNSYLLSKEESNNNNLGKV